MQLLKSIKKNFINPILQEIAVNLFKAIIATGIFGAGVALMTNSIEYSRGHLNCNWFIIYIVASEILDK